MAERKTYDSASAASLFDYSTQLLGKSIYEAAVELNSNVTRDELLAVRGKGAMGIMVEKYFFGYDPNNNPEADFAVAGVELKATPLKVLRSKALAIKERLVADMINYCEIVDSKFDDSPFYKKCVLMLLLFYVHLKGVEKCDMKYIYSVLWRLQGKDLQIIRQDYEIIMTKIRQGKAHEITEGDTMYLAACRKGSKGSDRTSQPFSDIPAPTRAFSLKTCYMRSVLEFVESSGKHWATNTDVSIAPKVKPFELVSLGELKRHTFEDIVRTRLMKFKGKDYKEILSKFNLTVSPTYKSVYPYATRAILSGGRMKGFGKTEAAEEIKKSDIQLKSVRLTANGRLKESVSFENIDYEEVLATEDFNDSRWREIVNAKFMFVVYREVAPSKAKRKLWQEEERFVLDRVISWTMPEEDMVLAKAYWENIRENTVNDIFREEPGCTYWTTGNNKKFHVRPKGTNGGSREPSPNNGRPIRRSCYWMNNSYVLEILRSAYGDEWQRIFNE